MPGGGCATQTRATEMNTKYSGELSANVVMHSHGAHGRESSDRVDFRIVFIMSTAKQQPI